VHSARRTNKWDRHSFEKNSHQRYRLPWAASACCGCRRITPAACGVLIQTNRRTRVSRRSRPSQGQFRVRLGVPPTCNRPTHSARAARQQSRIRSARPCREPFGAPWQTLVRENDRGRTRHMLEARGPAPFLKQARTRWHGLPRATFGGRLCQRITAAVGEPTTTGRRTTASGRLWLTQGQSLVLTRPQTRDSSEPPSQVRSQERGTRNTRPFPRPNALGETWRTLAKLDNRPRVKHR
jgi:hypothetical protein